MATDYQGIIDRLETAILNRLEGGAVAEYTIRGRNVRYASLEELRDLLDWAKRRLAVVNARGGPFAYGVPGRAGGPP